MGRKHRENYDDWWRCEVQFDAVLDEVFGISHTKQQIRPHPQLVEALTFISEQGEEGTSLKSKADAALAKMGGE